MVKDIVGDLNTDSFVKLLSKLIGESEYVQNNPPDLIPEEDRIVRHVLDSLLPYSTQTGGGPLIVKHVTYFPGRGNVIVEYPGTVPGKVLSFVGMHMDVVTANPNDWVFFSLFDLVPDIRFSRFWIFFSFFHPCVWLVRKWGRRGRRESWFFYLMFDFLVLFLRLRVLIFYFILYYFFYFFLATKDRISAFNDFLFVVINLACL